MLSRPNTVSGAHESSPRLIETFPSICERIREIVENSLVQFQPERPTDATVSRDLWSCLRSIQKIQPSLGGIITSLVANPTTPSPSPMMRLECRNGSVAIASRCATAPRWWPAAGVTWSRVCTTSTVMRGFRRLHGHRLELGLNHKETGEDTV